MKLFKSSKLQLKSSSITERGNVMMEKVIFSEIPHFDTFRKLYFIRITNCMK